MLRLQLEGSACRLRLEPGGAGDYPACAGRKRQTSWPLTNLTSWHLVWQPMAWKPEWLGGWLAAWLAERKTGTKNRTHSTLRQVGGFLDNKNFKQRIQHGSTIPFLDSVIPFMEPHVPLKLSITYGAFPGSVNVKSNLKPKSLISDP